MAESHDRALLSDTERRTPAGRFGLSIINIVLLVSLVTIGLLPLLWLFKSSVTPTRDTLRTPLEIWPNGIDLGTIVEAWNRVEIGKYFFNTLWVAGGSWAVQMIVCTTAAYALSVLRPWYGKYLMGLVVATLFVPGVVILVPLYLTVLKLPIVDVSLLNTFWAVWLPAGANAFHLLLMKRFFDSLPREVFEAARVDGAGPLRLFLSIVLPMSKPILAVVSVFAFVGAWKDVLWPMLVLPDPKLQPLSVRLPAIAPRTQLDTLMAGMAITTIIPLVLFLLFSRVFLRGGALGGAIKG